MTFAITLITSVVVLAVYAGSLFVDAPAPGLRDGDE
jgi:hypothetical protein